jgi:hypothetical protein
MNTRRVLSALAGSCLLAGSLLPQARAKELSCVGVSSQALYRNYGYDHVVHLVNRCNDDAVCEVSTDVNPEPSHATVPAKGEVDVLTFRGSPARTFTPRVKCHSAH